MSGIHARTDMANAERFVAECAGELRYVGTWGRWLHWTGKRWSLDDNGAAIECAKRVAAGRFLACKEEFDRIVTDASEALDARDAKHAVAEAKSDLMWAIKSQGRERLKACIDLACSDPRLAITHTELNADAWLLNAQNGTIDLRTGTLRRHSPTDLITKMASADFDADATCPTWERFIATAMGNNAPMVAFVQRILGYALTGVIAEHVLGFLFGGGANGKSTFVNTVHDLLGDYAARAPRDMLFKTSKNGHPTETVCLYSARFVSCSEIDEGTRFDEALVKDLTGGDPITTRRMREDFWTFMPTHKLFIAGNHRPSVRGRDNGIWRRLRLVPWTVAVPKAEQDADLPTKLRAEFAGILAWAVRGCLAWQTEGLGEPDEVLDATAAYRDECDPIAEFADSRLVFHPDAQVARKFVRVAYEEWCKENGAEPLGHKRFAEALFVRGVVNEPKKPHKIRAGDRFFDAWKGVRLRAAEDEAGRDDDDDDRGGVGRRNRDSGLQPVSEIFPWRTTGNRPPQVPTSPQEGGDDDEREALRRWS